MVLLSYISNSLIRTRTRDCAHVRLRIMGLEMLVFRKIWRTYLMDGPFWLCLVHYTNRYTIYYFGNTNYVISEIIKLQTLREKCPKYGVFSGPYFPVLRRFTGRNRKIRTRKTPSLDTFHGVKINVMRPALPIKLHSEKKEKKSEIC